MSDKGTKERMNFHLGTHNQLGLGKLYNVEANCSFLGNGYPRWDIFITAPDLLAIATVWTASTLQAIEVQAAREATIAEVRKQSRAGEASTPILREELIVHSTS